MFLFWKWKIRKKEERNQSNDEENGENQAMDRHHSSQWWLRSHHCELIRHADWPPSWPPVLIDAKRIKKPNEAKKKDWIIRQTSKNLLSSLYRQQHTKSRKTWIYEFMKAILAAVWKWPLKLSHTHTHTPHTHKSHFFPSLAWIPKRSKIHSRWINNNKRRRWKRFA